MSRIDVQQQGFCTQTIGIAHAHGGAVSAVYGDPAADLPQDEVHLWLCRVEQISVPTARRFLLSLAPAELRRHAAFRFERERQQFLLAHGLLRAVLSHYRPETAAAQWQFEENAYGKPSLSGAQKAGLAFNLSHAQGLVAIAVCMHAEPGVDVEYRDETLDVDGIAALILSPAEQQQFAAIGEDEGRRIRRFYDVWTLKEAYVKAWGVGMSLPLAQCSFYWQGDDRIAVDCEWQTMQQMVPQHGAWPRSDLYLFASDVPCHLALVLHHAGTHARKVRILHGSDIQQAASAGFSGGMFHLQADNTVIA